MLRILDGQNVEIAREQLAVGLTGGARSGHRSDTGSVQASDRGFGGRTRRLGTLPGCSNEFECR